MKMKQNTSLKAFNTFGIDVKAKAFVKVNGIDELRSVLKENNKPLLILGGGSNVLFTKDFDGLVVNNQIKGIEVLHDTANDVLIKVGAGEIWHEFVMYCIENGYAGVENLSLIPGSVGAAPMQNIGAYGVEVKDLITEVETIDINDLSLKTFSNEECKFDYRSSIFKTSVKGKYFITAVTFRLIKEAEINTSYGAIESELAIMGVEQPTIKAVSDAVIRIRRSKLPDPQKIGNSGSFFKNPVVSEEIKESVLQQYPSAPVYPQPSGEFKLAAGWLIEQCGWKGKQIENYGVHKKQALVLVNYGNAKGEDIYKLSEDIIQSVNQKFGITLEREVNII